MIPIETKNNYGLILTSECTSYPRDFGTCICNANEKTTFPHIS